MTDEAKWILDNVKLPERGTFVEVGAFDGVQGSNTLPFEELGWTGVCIEADPANAWRCAQNRTCKTVCAAIGSAPGLAAFYVDLDDRGLSGLERRPPNGKRIFVGVERLERVVQMTVDVGPDLTIDLLSIDTEGTELDVWMSLEPYRPKIVIIEWMTLGKPSEEENVARVLMSEGYTLRHKTYCNLIFTDT